MNEPKLFDSYFKKSFIRATSPQLLTYYMCFMFSIPEMDFFPGKYSFVFFCRESFFIFFVLHACRNQLNVKHHLRVQIELKIKGNNFYILLFENKTNTIIQKSDRKQNDLKRRPINSVVFFIINFFFFFFLRNISFFFLANKKKLDR